MLEYWLQLLIRAFWCSVLSLGQTKAGIVYVLLVAIVSALWLVRKHGWNDMKLHWWRPAGEGIVIALVAWLPIFLFHLVRTPYLMQQEAVTNAQKQQPYSFSLNDTARGGMYNLVLGFTYLARPCQVKVTAPRENIEVGKILASVSSSVGCNTEGPGDPDRNPDVEVEAMKGAIVDAVVIHVARRMKGGDALVTAVGNVFTVRRTYELPSENTPNLIWFQVGPGYPWRKD